MNQFAFWDYLFIAAEKDKNGKDWYIIFFTAVLENKMMNIEPFLTHRIFHTFMDHYTLFILGGHRLEFPNYNAVPL